jgi:carbon-monoxide dehydrogenase medium subunit
LINVTVTADLLSEAADALALRLNPQEDQQASPAMRRHLARVLLMRGVASLLGRSTLSNGAGK